MVTVKEIKDIEKRLNSMDDKDLSKLIESLTKSGETQRITSLYNHQTLFLFNMFAMDYAYFKELEDLINKNSDNGINFKSKIGELLEIYMNLAVSEVHSKDENLLQLLTNIFKAKEEALHNEQNIK